MPRSPERVITLEIDSAERLYPLVYLVVVVVPDDLLVRVEYARIELVIGNIGHVDRHKFKVLMLLVEISTVL